MSDSPDSSQPRASRDGLRRRRPARPEDAGTSAPIKPARKRRLPQLIKVAPEDLERHSPTALERLQKDARTGVPGLIGSAAVHALVLLVLALIVVKFEFSDDAGLELGWVSETTLPERTAGMAPVKIQPITPIKPLTPTTTTQADPNSKQAASQSRPVRPVNVENALHGRSERNRVGKLQASGTQNPIERAIKSGLEWLKRQQSPSGNWQLHQGYPDAGEISLRTDTGATALALLAYLGDGHTHRTGDYQTTVDAGLRWLKGVQKSDGDFHDHTELGRQTAFYAHSMATIAICEAYALTQDASLRKSAEEGIAFLLATQQPEQGGWRYRPQDRETMADLSVTGWALMALHSARMANIDVPPEAFGTASLFLDAVQTRDGDRYRYLPSDPIDKVTPAMTASGLVGRQWLGWEKNDPVMKSGVEWLTRSEFTPDWSAGRRNVYEWYYVAQVLHNIGGDDWTEYYNHVQSLLVEGQLRRGSRTAPDDVLGSWHPTRPDGHPLEYATQGGRLYLTVMCLLVLETPYRHAPVYAPGG